MDLALAPGSPSVAAFQVVSQRLFRRHVQAKDFHLCCRNFYQSSPFNFWGYLFVFRIFFTVVG